MILVDTSGIIALHEESNRYRERALSLLAIPQARVVSPFVLAELNYLITKYAGSQAALTFLGDVERGVYTLEQFTRDDIARARSIIERYADLQLGLADASIVVLAERHDCQDVLSMDQRHFRAITTAAGKPFRLLLLDPPQ
ncbi:MAG: PIN domain-containing protein [Chloroflexota bacterium]|nr:PIN domain-containing protein [Chloroflexota bacterium]